MSLLNFCCKSIFNITRKPKLYNVKITNSTRFYSKKCPKPVSKVKVTVIGAAGYVGQSVCLLLKQSPLIEELAIYDIVGVCGFGKELGYVDTPCKVSAYSDKEFIGNALKGAHVVVVVAAAPGTAYVSLRAMFESNAKVIQDITTSVACHCPTALLAIATQPVNSLVPLASEIMKYNGQYCHKRVFGVTALNVIRANTFVAAVHGLDPEYVLVPVIGGHADKTIVPVLSQAQPCSDFSNEEIECLTKKVQDAHNEVTNLKTKRSCILSSAFAITKFTLSLVKAIHGNNNIIECAYVRSKEHPNCKYMTTPILLGPEGIDKNLGIPELSEYERCLLEQAIPLITKDVRSGEIFAGIIDPPPCDPCDANPHAPPCPQNLCNKETESLD